MYCSYSKSPSLPLETPLILNHRVGLLHYTPHGFGQFSRSLPNDVDWSMWYGSSYAGLATFSPPNEIACQGSRGFELS